MPCYSPLKGWRSKAVNSTGKRSIVFNQREGLDYMPVTIPCGKCIGCRLEKSRQWAIRCIHEASLYEENCFITLTYDDENLPKDGSLVKRDFQLFMKRLRKEIYPKKVRYYQCGEYGDVGKRPHYHACIFGYDFGISDCDVIGCGINKTIKSSKVIAKLWDKGFNTVGEVTFESAAYVARYILKKMYGKDAVEHYDKIDKKTGEVLCERVPEYTTMSRRPGIGKDWLDKYGKEVYNSDSVIIRGMEVKPPKYYDEKYKSIDKETMAKIFSERKKVGKKVEKVLDAERLVVKEKVQIAKQKLFEKRGYENDRN